MTTLIILVVVAGGLAWRFGYWPFNGAYPQLPQYGVSRQPKVEPPESPKSGL
jgi:hypothetical protein